MTDLISRLHRYGKELEVCNEAADEIERLTQALKKANDQAEHFERDLYWRLHSLSKALESSGRIDAYDYPDAYATVLDAMNAVRSKTRSQALADAGFTRRPSLRAMEMRAALELIAAPQRPDGTWNRDRAACREIAAEALGCYDDSKTPNVRAKRALPVQELT